MKYLLVEMAIDDDGDREYETDAEATRRKGRVPNITYLGSFDRIEDALAEKARAEHNNPGMASAFTILMVIE